MTFVNPLVLWALSLTAIPIIIHLFNFRRYKTVYFTNVKFLKEVTEETAVRSKVKHWLVLVSRILGIAFLVFAFAQPVIPLEKDTAVAAGRRGISVYVDNSFSMSAETEDEQLLNRAVRRAREIANAYGDDDRFQLLTNEFSSRQQRLVTKEEFLSMLDEVVPTSTVRTLNDVFSIQQKTFSDSKIDDKHAFWISDFQKNIVDFRGDTSVTLSLLPLQPVKQHNLYIDTAWLDQPALYQEQPARLIVKIVNISEKDVENSRLTLSVDGQVKAIADYNVSASSFTLDTVNFSVRDTGWRSVEVALTDYPVTFDDTYFLSLRIIGQVEVLAINDDRESKYLQALFTNAQRFTFRNQPVSRLDYSGLKRFSLIVLNNLSTIPSGLAHELAQYLADGGVLLIFPNARADILSYNRFFSSVKVNHLAGVTGEEMPVTYLNKEHEIFQDVFEEIPRNISLPTAKIFFRTQKTVESSEQVLLGLRDGSPFVSCFDAGKGKVYLCASPLDDTSTDFPTHALFVPMLHKMALSGGVTGKAAYVLGKDEVIEVENKLRSTDDICKMKGADNEFIPRQKAVGSKVLITLGEQVTAAGIYNVFTANEKEGQLVALNYDRKESQLDYYSASDLKDLFPQKNIRVLDAAGASITGMVKALQQGIVLWKVCIILALVFLGAEVLLLRFLK